MTPRASATMRSRDVRENTAHHPSCTMEAPEGEGIGIGGRRAALSYAPPTPPDVRVRIRRFGELRLGDSKSGDAELIKVRRGQRSMESRMACHPPPVARKPGRHRGDG